MEYLLYEVPPFLAGSDEGNDPEAVPGLGERYRDSVATDAVDEQAPTLDGTAETIDTSPDANAMQQDLQTLTSTLQGLNALEIAAVSDAKDFLTQPAIQGIIDDIWRGDIVLWSEVSVHAEKKPRRHDPKYVSLHESCACKRQHSDMLTFGDDDCHGNRLISLVIDAFVIRYHSSILTSLGATGKMIRIAGYEYRDI